MTRSLCAALALLVAAAPAVAQTFVSGPITANTTWDAVGSPYIVTGRVTVEAGVTLTVDAADVLFNQSQSLWVEGALAATGATFGSNVATPTRSSWDRIRVGDGATATFTDTIIEYANRAVELIEGGTATFDGADIRNVFLAIETQPRTSRGDTVYPAWATGGFSFIDTIVSSSYAVGYLRAPAPYTSSGSVFSGNDFEALFVYFSAHTGTWAIPAGPTVVWWTVNANLSDTLVVEAGAVVKNRGNRRRVRTLTAVGTLADPVVFTAYTDDSVGGDSDNATTSPSPGFGELEVVERATVQFAEFRYGNAGALRLDGRDGAGDATATVTDSRFVDNIVGVYAARVDLALADNVFSGNTRFPLEASVGVRGDIGPATNVGLLDYLPLTFDIAGAASAVLRDTLYDAGLPYVLDRTGQIRSFAELTVQPGVVVKVTRFIGVDVQDGGVLRVEGTAAEPAVFTSIADDSAGGDTNGDGNTTTPGPQDWSGILFRPGSSGTLTGADVRYASQSSFSYSGTTYLRSAISAFGADLVLADSRVADSERGVRSVDGTLSVTGTDFVNTGGAPVAIGVTSTPTFSGNTMSNPGLAAIGLLDGTATTDATLALRDFAGVSGITYVLEGDLTIGEGADVTVEPGVVIKTTGNHRITVDGGLALAGTAASPIVVTDRRDDSVGNPADTNGDGNTTSPSPGSWAGILFRPTTDVVASPVSNLEIRYARDGLGLSEADLTVTDVEVSNGSAHGLIVDRYTAPTISGLTIRNLPADTEPIMISLESAPVLTNVSLVSTGSRGVGLLEDIGTSLVPRRTLLDDVTLAPRALAGLTAVPYVLRSQLVVPESRTLTIAPGTIFKLGIFNAVNRIRVDGALVADAEGGDPIVFTSLRDDSIGGDTNADGNDTSPARGNWRNIELAASALDDANLLRNVVVRYGTSLVFDGADGRFENSLYEQMSGPLTFSGAPSPVVAGNEFLNISTVPVAISPFATPVFSANTVSNVPTLALGLLGGTFVSDFTLGPRSFAGFDSITYVPTGGAFNVDPGATLTIPAGTVFKFPGVGTGLTITGAFRTTGTAAEPVVFTSVGDDRYGNPADTNQDGDTAPGRSADTLIRFTDGTDDANTVLAGVVLAHSRIGIEMTSAAPTIRDSRFEFIEQAGIELREVSAPTLEGNTFADFDAFGVPLQFSLASDFTASGNRIEGQTMEALGIAPETLVSDATLPRRSFAGRPGIPYYLPGLYTVGTGAVLSVEPGVVVKSRGGSIVVERGLGVVGGAAPGDKVVFTSIQDDFYGGDTNRDSTATSPAPGQWTGITVRDQAVDGLVTLDHVVVRYASEGLRAESASPTITNARFENNRTGLHALGTADPTVSDSDFDGNITWGILNEGTFTLDATGNWWGDDSGPTVDTNPDGAGDAISGSVSFVPFVGTGTQNPVLGDVSLNGAVQAFDAAEILGHLVSPSLTAAQLAVADVSGNAEVMAMDASLVLQYVVGLIDAFPAEAEARRGAVPAVAGATLGVGAPFGVVGDTLRLPVTLNRGNAEVFAVELGVRAVGATVVGVEAGPGAQGATSAAAAVGDAGRFVLASTAPLTGGGPLAHVVVRLDATDAQVSVERAVVNETVLDGGAVDAEGPPPETFGLTVAGANPFRGATALRLDVPEPSAVRMEVVDALGRRVAVLLDRAVPAGAYPVRWDARGASPGVYFVRVAAGAESAVARLVVVR